VKEKNKKEKMPQYTITLVYFVNGGYSHTVHYFSRKKATDGFRNYCRYNGFGNFVTAREYEYGSDYLYGSKWC